MNGILADVDDVDNELDIVFGEYRDRQAVNNFVTAVRNSNLTGTLYIGYPVLAVDDEKVEFDALLVSRDRGVIIFDLYSYTGSANANQEISKDIIKKQEQLYAALYNRLNSFSELRHNRDLIVRLCTATIHPVADCFKFEDENIIIGINKLDELQEIEKDKQLNDEKIQHLNATVQRISNLKPRKQRDNVTNPNSMGATIKEIEKQVANLDFWQKRGAIEYVDGPQRIRGLAGSGKTVVLALKAAYLHVKRPDWNIVITFSTRSLYQQFENLVTRFVFSQISEEPNWEKLNIKHAWGASDRDGVYKDFVNHVGGAYHDFGTAARLFGYDNAFRGACREALKASSEIPEKYDMILVDEAQDLSPYFFKIVYRLTKHPKRIVWAYDDLQNLGDTKMPSPDDLFGYDHGNRPLVTLTNGLDEPKGDIILPRCYRTPPWTLLTAHGLGFGIHRNPMANMFQDISIWERLGYSPVDGEIRFNTDVKLERTGKSVPNFFGKLLKPDESLKFFKFDTKEEQYEWVANQIKTLLEQQELEHSDFLIILPNVLTNKRESLSIMEILTSNDLPCHIPGQTSSRDQVIRDNSIAITQIHRAKGNEAPVVFILNADFCENKHNIKTRRNVIFTAMTRAKAWTYVMGVGEDMGKIQAEFEKIKRDKFRLKFHYPTQERAEELAISTDEIAENSNKNGDKFDDLRTALKKFKAGGGQLPLDIKEAFREISGEGR